MKKMLVILVVLMLTFSVSALAEGYFNARLGYDMSGTMDLETTVKAINGNEVDESDSEDIDVEGGVSLTVEYIDSYKDNLELGVGATYQLERSFEDGNGGFNFIPLYALAKYNVDQIYLLGHLGYNLVNFEDMDDSIDLNGGIYYGVGGGYNLSENFAVELLYSVNNSDFDFDFIEDGTEFETSNKFKYSKVSLGASLSF